MSALPPHDIAAEQACLGACLLDQEAVTVIAEILAGPDDFFRQDHGYIYQGIKRLHERGRSVDLITLTSILARAKTEDGQSNYLEECGGPGYLDGLISIVQSSAHVSAYAQIVADRAIERRLAMAAKRIEWLAVDADLSPATKIERASQILERAGAGASRCQAVPAREALETFGDWLNERQLTREQQESGEKPPSDMGISIGFPKLDRLMGGAVPGEVIIVAARPGMGKTAFGTSVAGSLAEQGPCMFWSGEMTSMKIARRLASSGLGIPVRDIRAADAYRAAESAPAIWIDDERGISAQRLATKVATFKLRHPNMSGLVVDYLSLLAESNDYKEVSRASRKLLEIAGRHSIPVIALQQLSRDVERRDSKVPQLGDLRESGQIEQDASVVLMPYRPHYYNADADPERAEIWIRKNRDGPANRHIVLLWDAKSATFRNPTPKTRPQQGALDISSEEIPG